MSAANELTKQYTAALEAYLSGAQEEALRRSYELGREAIARGVGILEMASIQSQCVAAVAKKLSRSDPGELAMQSAAFFAESLSSYEMVLRGFREANANLRTNLRQLEAAEHRLQQRNQELAAAHQEVEAERQRYRELFHFAPGGYLVTDLDGTFQEVNNAAAHLLGVEPGAIAGASLTDFLNEAEQDSFREQLAMLRRGRLESVEDWEARVRGAGGEAVPVSLRVKVVRDRDGHRALRWLMSDVRERRRLEEERDQLRIREHIARAETEAAQGMKFLAEASATLASSLDYETTLASIARLAVPYLADFCLLHLTERDGEVQAVHAVHTDAACRDRVRALEQVYARQGRLSQPLAAILSRSRPELVAEISSEWLRALAGSSKAHSLLQGCNFHSAILAPLFGQTKCLGTLTLIRSKARRPFRAGDVDLVEVFARRGSLVLDNAILHAQVVAERDKAGRASRAKDEFVAVLSHELRSPLTAILGWSRILKRHPAVQGQQILSDAVRSVEHHARNVARLVEDCLDITRIAEGKIRIQQDWVDLNEVIRATLDASREAALRKELQFSVSIGETPLPVLGDRTRLEQVLSNVISNAVRYTAVHGKISIASRVESNTSGSDQEALVSVQDTGTGIASELLEQIFQPFRQGSQYWLESDSGLGLGLAISREIVQMHGGAIWAESDGAGCGSTFHVRLPLARGVAPAAAPAELAPRERGKTGRLRVLLIEDSVEILDLLRMELSDEGFTLLTATEAKSGLELARHERPDAVVSDIKMPGMDGYEFMRQLRRIPELAHVPAVALTGFGMRSDVERALAAGYDAHLCKPVEVEQLACLIDTLVSKTRLPKLQDA